MAYSLLTCMPCEVVKKIVDRGSEVVLKERLKKGWGVIHDEMMWRESHHYSCTYHFCDVAECGCYTRYPGFLLRRVDARIWLAGQGETRELEAGEWIPEVSNAIWIDFNANEMGLMNSMIPVIQPDEPMEQPADHELLNHEVIHQAFDGAMFAAQENAA